MLVCRRVYNWLEYSTTFRQPFRAATTRPTKIALHFFARSAGSPSQQHGMGFFGRFSKHRNNDMESPERPRNEEFGYSIWNELNFKKHKKPPEVSKCHGFAAKTELPSHHTNLPTRGNTVFCTVFSHHRRLRKTQRSGTSGACTDFKFHVIHNGARRRGVGFCWCFNAFCQKNPNSWYSFFCLIQREGNTYINTIISI